MTRWLTDQWFDETRETGADLPPQPGLTAVMQFEVTGGPDGDVSCHFELDEGRIASGAPGAVDAPDLTLTSAWKDAAAMQRGELDPSVAFMQGRMKVAGSMRAMIALLRMTRTADYQVIRRRIASVTDF